MNNKIIPISIFCFLFLFSLVSAYSYPESLHLNIQTEFANGTIETGTFNFWFNITTNETCNVILYSNLTTQTTNSRGIISYYLENINIDYDQELYLCMYRDGVLKSNSLISPSPQSNIARNSTISGLIIDDNLNMSNYNLTADYLFSNDWSNVSIGIGQITNFVANNDSIKNYANFLNTSQNNYITQNNNSVVNWVNSLFVQISNIVNLVGNWSADKVNYPTLSILNNGSYLNQDLSSYATTSYVDTQNTSQTNYINSNNASVTNALNTKLSLSGGTMTGNISLGTNCLTNGTAGGSYICFNGTGVIIRG